MEKITIIAVIVVALVIVGTIFVSAALQQDKEEVSVTQTGCAKAATCGANTCDGQCGGSCGRSSCGCGS